MNQDSSHVEASWRSGMHTLIARLGLGSHRSAEAGGLPLSRLSEQKPLGLRPAVAGELPFPGRSLIRRNSLLSALPSSFLRFPSYHLPLC